MSKMNINILKVIIQKLSIFKSNAALLLPIAIALVGIIVFIPTQLMSSKLKKQIESESIKIGRSIPSASKTAVSSEQWKKELERQRDCGSDANEISLLAKRSTQRELLSYKIFPEPKDKSQFTFVEFGKRYCDALESLVTGINGHDCPTDTELKRALDASSARSGLDSKYRTTNLYTRPASSTKLSGTSLGMLSTVEDTIVDEICRERAKSISVYANPAELSGYNYWKEYKYESQIEEAVSDCWYYQLAYWIIEDVINTIDAINAKAGSDNVLTSPVKRLMSMYFKLGGGGYQTTSLYGTSDTKSKKAGTGDRPAYVLSSQNALIEPYTGRYCNADIDVIHFNVVVIVGTEAVLPFMQKLCSAKEHKFSGFSGDVQEDTYKHNQITILESNISSIDRNEKEHSSCRYGDDAVVELDLTCEYIFNKAGYEEIKPASVKEAQKPKEKEKKKTTK
jgi:hypothetical protein